MTHPVLKFDENHKPLIEGNFEFSVGKIIHDPIDFTPRKLISFPWSVEMQQDLEAFENNEYNEMCDAIGEKLKQDFIKLLKTKVDDGLIIKLPPDEDLDDNGNYIGNDPIFLNQ